MLMSNSIITKMTLFAFFIGRSINHVLDICYTGLAVSNKAGSGILSYILQPSKNTVTIRAGQYCTPIRAGSDPDGMVIQINNGIFMRLRL